MNLIPAVPNRSESLSVARIQATVEPGDTFSGMSTSYLQIEEVGGNLQLSTWKRKNRSKRNDSKLDSLVTKNSSPVLAELWRVVVLVCDPDRDPDATLFGRLRHLLPGHKGEVGLPQPLKVEERGVADSEGEAGVADAAGGGHLEYFHL